MNQQIKDLLKRKRISQQMVANAAGMSRISLNRYLNGHTDVASEKFIKILLAIGGEVILEATPLNKDIVI